jgi:osmotically-inducible protein OsmY
MPFNREFRMRANDRQLQAAILDELHRDAMIDAPGIGVAVTDGVATLFGEIASMQMKDVAVDAAVRVRGIQAVADRLTLHCPGSLRRTDTDIARDVAAALRQSETVASIKACIEFADLQQQRDSAEAAVAGAKVRTLGLKRIANDVRVSSGAAIPQGAIPDAST